MTDARKNYMYPDCTDSEGGYRRGGRAAEGPALEKRYPGENRDRGFESHPLRHLLRMQILIRKYKFRLPGKGMKSVPKQGEMTELAEGARLEIVCAVNSGTEGSNPSLSAR